MSRRDINFAMTPSLTEFNGRFSNLRRCRTRKFPLRKFENCVTFRFLDCSDSQVIRVFPCFTREYHISTSEKLSIKTLKMLSATKHLMRQSNLTQTLMNSRNVSTLMKNVSFLVKTSHFLLLTFSGCFYSPQFNLS